MLTALFMMWLETDPKLIYVPIGYDRVAAIVRIDELRERAASEGASEDRPGRLARRRIKGFCR
jgi:hypothetical protein